MSQDAVQTAGFLIIFNLKEHPMVNLLMPRVLSAALIGFVLTVTANAQDAQPLNDDASRGQLFEYMGETIEGKESPADFTQYAFRAAFRFAHDARWKNPALEEDPRSNQIFGIDVSHHNTDGCHCQINWEKLADQDVAFAYLK